MLNYFYTCFFFLYEKLFAVNYFSLPLCTVLYHFCNISDINKDGVIEWDDFEIAIEVDIVNLNLSLVSLSELLNF